MEEQLKKFIEDGINKIGRENMDKATEAQFKIAAACIGVRADLAMAAMTYNLGQVYHAGFAPKGISKPEFMKLAITALEAAVDWGPNPSLREFLDKEEAKEPLSKGTPNKNSPWR